MEALGSRVNMIEAERQQSEARVKEEVDASLGQKMGAIDQVGRLETGRVRVDRWVAIVKLAGKGRLDSQIWMNSRETSKVGVGSFLIQKIHCGFLR